MSKDEIKYEINRVLDHLSDKTLSDLLAFLRNIESKESVTLLNNSIVDRLLAEDNELLHKLAK